VDARWVPRHLRLCRLYCTAPFLLPEQEHDGRTDGRVAVAWFLRAPAASVASRRRLPWSRIPGLARWDGCCRFGWTRRLTNTGTLLRPFLLSSACLCLPPLLACLPRPPAVTCYSVSGLAMAHYAWPAARHLFTSACIAHSLPGTCGGRRGCSRRPGILRALVCRFLRCGYRSSTVLLTFSNVLRRWRLAQVAGQDAAASCWFAFISVPDMPCRRVPTALVGRALQHFASNRLASVENVLRGVAIVPSLNWDYGLRLCCYLCHVPRGVGAAPAADIALLLHHRRRRCGACNAALHSIPPNAAAPSFLAAGRFRTGCALLRLTQTTRGRLPSGSVPETRLAPSSRF